MTDTILFGLKLKCLYIKFPSCKFCHG